MKPKTLNFVSLSFFTLILICFFLPFVSITCADTKIAKLKGTDLAFGTKIEYRQGEDLFGRSKQTEKVEPELFALLAFLLTIIGLVISTIALSSKIEKQKNFQIALSIISLLIFISILALKFKLDSDISGRGELSGLELKYEAPYWIVLISSVINFLLVVFFRSVKSDEV
jgi:ABC-type Na+ efflux pump permease subunit